jgi:rhamnosyltransferase
MDPNQSPRVAVLLATYNGLAYLADQLESILNQQGCAVDVWVSDDQSSDGTWEWLQEKSRTEPRIFLLPRTRRFGNAARNFYRLFRDSDPTRYDYIALSDQDDIWLPNKLALSIEKLHEHAVSVVSSNVIAMWPDGRRKLIRKSQKQRRLDFLFGSAGPGCTYLLTAECAAKFKTFVTERPAEVDAVQFHDWMLYAWARSHGYKWHIEPRPTMLYRQHASNEYGANAGWTAFRRRLEQVRSGWYRDQILQISRLVRDGRAFDAECSAIVRLVEQRTIAARIALITKVRELRREMKDRVLLVLAWLLSRI